MACVSEIIQRVFPHGTNPGGPERNTFPFWPPDGFAIAATLVNLSGCYCRPRYAGGLVGDSLFSPQIVHFGIELGGRWAEMPAPTELAELQDLWDVLLDPANGDVADSQHARYSVWTDTAFKLLMAADEACVGAGFATQPESSPVAALIMDQYNLDEHDPARKLPHLPHSLCCQVDPADLCVQPKARTPQLGCTLRSLTHHLALLPPKGDVLTPWYFGLDAEANSSRDLNLLLIPFPYRIEADCFIPGPQIQRPVVELLAWHEWDKDGRRPGRDKIHWSTAERHVDRRAFFFDLDQRWLLHPDGNPITADEISVFVRRLMQQARSMGHEVNGVVFPELALDKGRALQIADLLVNEPALELFIAGVANPAPPDSAIPKNEVYTRVYRRGGLPWRAGRSQSIIGGSSTRARLNATSFVTG